MSQLRWLADDSRVMTGAIMTTFPFSPDFFERSVLPALRNKNSDIRTAILMDVDQYDELLDVGSTAGELGHRTPDGLGQTYQVGPVGAPANRTFHPKVHLLAGANRVQVTVGSGNLTHPGMTNNQEIVTRFELSHDPEDDEANASALRETKARLYGEVEGFLDSLIGSPFGSEIGSVTERTIEEVLEAGAWVHDIQTADSGANDTRFLHSLSQPLLDQTFDLISSRGETITHADVVAPFYGTSMRVPTYLTEHGIQTTLWLQDQRSQIETELLESWLVDADAEAMTYDGDRYVHGKLLRFRTGEAAYTLSGSPNASQAALLSAADDGGNIETAIYRRRPESDGFIELLETSPFTSATQLDIDTFEAATLPSRFDVDASEKSDTDTANFVLQDVSYFRHQTFDGGRLRINGYADDEVKGEIEENGVTLVVDAPDTDTPRPITLSSWGFEWTDATDGQEFIYEQKRTSGEDAVFASTAIARLMLEDQVSNDRWIQVHRPAASDPTDEELADSGTTAVPERIIPLFSADGDSREAIMGSIGTLLQGLSQRSDSDSGSRNPRESDEPRGGLSLSSWSPSTEQTPGSAAASFLEGWQDEIRTFVRETSSRNRFIDDVGRRLGAINLVDIQLLVLENAKPDQEIPRQAVVNSIKDVYTKRDRDGAVTSLVGDFYYNLRMDRDAEAISQDVFQGLQTEIVPKLLVAAIMTESHLSESPDAFHKQHGWAFEQLIGQAYPGGYPSATEFEREEIDGMVNAIRQDTEIVRERIRADHNLNRHASHRYLDDDSIRRAVIELFGRSVLYAGSEAIIELREADASSRQLADVFENRSEFLPRDKRLSIESIL